MIDDCYINNLAEVEVCAVFIRVLFGEVFFTQINSTLYGDATHVGDREGHKHGGRIVTETSVIEFCYLNEKLLL